MRQELIRINSTDGIELPGILYTPDDNTNKIVIHIHGLSGNFYENRFIDILAKTYTNKGYALITFNNRGKDYITEMLKGDDAIVAGSCYELFEECILDIEGIVNWVKDKGFNEIALQGHSYGCNKVIYYYDKKREDCIKNIVLLAPCDIPKEIEIYTGDEYQNCIKSATNLVKNNKEDELIDFNVFANGKISAKTFYTDFLYESSCDFFRYREKNTKSKILNKIQIPVLIIFGSEDSCVLTEPKETVESYLKNNIKDCKIKIIANTDHSYTGKYEELGKIVGENI